MAACDAVAGKLMTSEVLAAPGSEILAESKTRLATLNGLLEKLQMQKIDSVATAELNSGQALARVRRKGLNANVEAAIDRCTKLHSKAADALRH